MKNFINKVFKLDENSTTVKTEIIAGLTTFFAMCYIIVVNPMQMTNFTPGPIWNACFVGGIISAVIATLCMAFIANKPFALAAGMGLNSFFFVSFMVPCLASPETLENGYGAGLAIIFLSGMVFLILSLTGLRKKLAVSLPACLKAAIPAGIGLFIAFIGLQNSKLIVNNDYVLVSIADFTNWVSAAPALVAFIGFIVIVILSKSKNKFFKGGAVILGILVATGVYYLFSIWTPELRVQFNEISIGTVFSDWVKHGLFNLNFTAAFDGSVLGSVFSAIMLIVTFCLVDMFDTIGTVYGAATEANLLDENGDPQNLQQIMACDAIGTVVGSLTGTSTITTFVESSAGVAAGGKTGLSSVVTAILFLICLFVAPLVSYVPSAATAPALIYVGVLMCKNIVKVDFTDIASAATAFMTFLMMIATYSISNGIMIGAITYVLITLLTGKYTKKDIIVTFIAVLGVLKFVFVKM